MIWALSYTSSISCGVFVPAQLQKISTDQENCTICTISSTSTVKYSTVQFSTIQYCTVHEWKLWQIQFLWCSIYFFGGSGIHLFPLKQHFFLKEIYRSQNHLEHNWIKDRQLPGSKRMNVWRDMGIPWWFSADDIGWVWVPVFASFLR